MSDSQTQFHKIIIPTRIQNDTAVAIYLLQKFGLEKFPGIQNATIETLSHLPGGETADTLYTKGILLIDIGGGIFDHHSKEVQTTATELICEYLGIQDNPALEKIRQYVQRCDFFGKGIISTDPLDKAFGLPGLLINVNKKYNSEPNAVYGVLFPLIDAHYLEEERRTIGMPLEVEEKMKSKEAEIFEVKQRDKKLKCIFIASDNVSLPGYLRSQIGGRFDVVIMQLASGHINILTRPTKRVDLRQFVAIVRRSELMKKGSVVALPHHVLSQIGRVDKIPEWYYDPATNSLQNGGINPGQTSTTRLNRQEIIKLAEVGLSL